MEQFQQQIIEASKMCLSGDKQLMEQGQKFLQDSQLTPQFASALMLLIDNEQHHMNERQFAITQLKSLVEKKWRKSTKFPTLSEEDKNDVKKNILEAMIRVSSEKKLYKTYDKIIFLIATQDYPQNWPQIITEIKTKIETSDDYNVLFGSLATLSSLLQVYEYQIEDDRQPLEYIVSQTFPQLLLLAQKLYQNYSVQTAILIQLILKCFYKAINLDIPKYFGNFDLLKDWFTLFKIIIEFDVPQEYKQIYQKDSDIMAQNKVSFWKNKKLVGKLLMRFAQKYTNANYENKHTQGLSQFFLTNYSTQFIDMFIQILYSSQNQFVSMPTLHFSMRYIQMCLRIKDLIQYMTPKLTDLAIKVCIPITALTNKDQSLFLNDPIEFMRKEEDFSQTMYNPKNAALDLIEIIAKQNNQQHLIELMEFFYLTLSTNMLGGQPLANNQKDGILWTFGELFPDIMKNQQLKNQIEPILQNFVLPLHNAPEPYLRSRVIWLYGVYGCIEYQNQQTVNDMTKVMCAGITEQNLIIKTRSAIALNKFIKQKIAKDIVRVEVKKLIEFYLKLMEEVDSEELVGALEGIIENYGSEVKDFSIGLVQQLVEAFNRYDEKENEGGDDDDAMFGEGEFAAAGCLNAINQILKNDLDPQVYQQLENIVYPVMTYSLTEESEYLEEGLDMIAIFFQRVQNISEQMYFLFIATTYMLAGIPEEINIGSIAILNSDQKHVLESVREGWGTEFCYKVLPIYKNVIQKSKNNFLTMTDFLERSFVDTMFLVVENTIKTCIINEDDTDMTNILHYFLAFIENNLKNEQTYPVVQKIVNSTLSYLNQHSKYKNFSRNCYIVICTAMIYDYKLVLQILESNNITQQFFEIMLATFMKAKKPSQNTDLELQKVIMGLSEILTIPQQQIPQSILAILPTLMNTFSFLVSMILELRECDESEEEEDNENDDDDDDFFEKVSYADKYDTPLDDTDELIDFQQKLTNLQNSNSAMFTELINLLSADKQQKLDKDLKEAQSQYEEYKKNQANN